MGGAVMKRNKSYRYRIYPNDSQVRLFQKTFGCCRFVYNRLLELQHGSYENGDGFLSWTKCNNYCNHVLKEEYPFLREVDKFALTNSILNLNASYQAFFKNRSGQPCFKSKKAHRKSYTTNYSHDNIVVHENGIKLPKVKFVKARIHRHAPENWVLKGATVSQEPDGNYYCSVLYQYDLPETSFSPDEKKVIGLDYKSDGLYYSSVGTVCGSPKYYKKGQKKLAREEKKLSRKKKGSRNYEKQRLKLAKQHRHIANQRKDYLHKESLKLAERWDIVCAEKLDLKDMSDKHTFKNGKANLDNGYAMFLEFLQYKLEDRGKAFVQVDPYYPSSQKCSLCGKKNLALKQFEIREWMCPECFAIHDRDYNAATNIEREGLRIYRESHQAVA